MERTRESLSRKTIETKFTREETKKL